MHIFKKRIVLRSLFSILIPLALVPLWGSECQKKDDLKDDKLPLQIAVEEGNLKGVETLYHEADYNPKDPILFYARLIYTSIMAKHLPITKFFFERQEEHMQKIIALHLDNLLLFATLVGDISILAYLTHYRKNVTQKNKKLLIPLLRYGTFDQIEALYKKDKEVIKVQDDTGGNVFHNLLKFNRPRKCLFWACQEYPEGLHLEDQYKISPIDWILHRDQNRYQTNLFEVLCRNACFRKEVLEKGTTKLLYKILYDPEKKIVGVYPSYDEFMYENMLKNLTIFFNAGFSLWKDESNVVELPLVIFAQENFHLYLVKLSSLLALPAIEKSLKNNKMHIWNFAEKLKPYLQGHIKNYSLCKLQFPFEDRGFNRNLQERKFAMIETYHRSLLSCYDEMLVNIYVKNKGGKQLLKYSTLLLVIFSFFSSFKKKN